MGHSLISADSRLARIDVLRGVAILMVVAFHAYGVTLGWGRPEWGRLLSGDVAASEWSFWALAPLHIGRVGVSLFFVISGYVIHRSYLRNPRFTWGGYFSRRFWRIYPAYLVALLVFANWLDVVWTRDFALHAVLLHNTSALTFEGINGSFWSLAVEVQIYALYPLAILARRKWGVGGMLLTGYAASAVWRIGAAVLSDWPGPMNFHIWCGPIPYWGDWLLGAYLAERHASGERVFARPAVWIVAGAALWMFGEGNLAFQSIQFSLAAIVSAAALEVTLLRPAPLDALGRGLSVVGVWSYSLYLIHLPFMFEYARFLTERHIPPAVQLAVCFPVYAMASLLVSWAMYATVERGGAWLGERLPATEARSPAFRRSSFGVPPSGG